MADETLLVITVTGGGVAPYSARGLTQSLAPIRASEQIRRTVNGELVDFSNSAFEKYQSIITGRDQLSPAVNGIWPGQSVVVDCVAELSYLTASGSPDRPVVSGSSRVEGLYTYYRPQLTMLVVRHTLTEDEWARAVGWQLILEEV